MGGFTQWNQENTKNQGFKTQKQNRELTYQHTTGSITMLHRPEPNAVNI